MSVPESCSRTQHLLGSRFSFVRRFRYRGNRAFFDLYFHVISDLNEKRSLFYVGDQAVDSAIGDYFVPGLETGEKIALFLLSFLLRPDQQKVEDDEHENQRRESNQRVTLASRGRRRLLLSKKENG